MSIESVIPSSYLILCHPLLLLPSIFPSIRVFSNGSALRIRWPKYWSFSFNISPSNEHSGLISFRMDWLDLLAVQGTLTGLIHLTASWSYCGDQIMILFSVLQSVRFLKSCHTLPIILLTLAFHNPGSWRGANKVFRAIGPIRGPPKRKPEFLSTLASIQGTVTRSPLPEGGSLIPL